MGEDTQSVCTTTSPCGIDEAPVCQAIANSDYTLDSEPVPVLSAYSWFEWCHRAWPPTDTWTDCDASSTWAACMMAPCTAHSDGEFARCQCAVNQGAYLDNDAKRRCNYPPDTIKASVPAGFDFGFFDGKDHVFQACAASQTSRYPKH